MGLLDDIKKTAEQARVMALDHRYEMDRTIDRAAEVADSKTGNKHTGHIQKVSNVAHGLVAKLEKD